MLLPFPHASRLPAGPINDEGGDVPTTSTRLSVHRLLFPSSCDRVTASLPMCTCMCAAHAALNSNGTGAGISGGTRETKQRVAPEKSGKRREGEGDEAILDRSPGLMFMAAAAGAAIQSACSCSCQQQHPASSSPEHRKSRDCPASGQKGTSRPSGIYAAPRMVKGQAAKGRGKKERTILVLCTVVVAVRLAAIDEHTRRAKGADRQRGCRPARRVFPAFTRLHASISIGRGKAHRVQARGSGG